MTIFAIQYLEYSSDLRMRSASEVRARLHAALECLPISIVLLGGNLPPPLFDACADETMRFGARLFLWYSLLTGDGLFAPRLEWQTIGLDGGPVPGFQSLPEFTFVCPNQPCVQEAVLARLQKMLDEPIQGVFLDRIRFPSPAMDPARYLACFCPDCQRQAIAEGIDLQAIQRKLRSAIAVPEGALHLIAQILSPSTTPYLPDLSEDLQAFLNFRKRSITRFVHSAADLVHSRGLDVGLDCFTPLFTNMVGQDLGALDPNCDWIKIMSYGHALGPAGIPFELICLADWLVAQFGMGEGEALELLEQSIQLPLPRNREDLRRMGFPPQALAGEVRRARFAGVRHLLAGIELVEIEGIAELNNNQISQDLDAFKAAGPDGLALSWDLWRIPIKRLELVKRSWTGL